MPADPAFEATLAAARSGDEEAWRALYESLAGPLLGYLRARGAVDPEDLLGEVFLQLARNLRRFRGDEGALRGWAFLVARNRIIDERRRAARRPTAVPDATGDERVADGEGGDVEAEALDRLESDRVAEMLATLTADQREVLTLRVIGDLSLEQVAGIVGKRVGAVKQLQHRALNTLRRALESPPGEAAHSGEGRESAPEGVTS